ncbi:MAG: outer membrane protein transport protein [Halioglobus sp.]
MIKFQTAAALAILSLPLLSQAAGPAASRLNASADNTDTVGFNPAGMTRLEGRQFGAEVILIKSWSKFDVDENRTTVDGGSPRDSDPEMLPLINYSHQLDDRWFAGVALNVPSGFGASNGPNWAGRYYTDSFSLVYVGLTPSLAYKMTDKLSVSAGIQVMYADSSIKTRINNDPFNTEVGDGRLKGDSDGVGLGYTVSALYEFTEFTRVGLVYRSEVDPELDTTLDFRNAVRPPGIIDGLQGETINLDDRVPQIIAAGLFHQFDNQLEVTVDTIWTEFSKFGVTEIHLHGNDINVPESDYNDFFTITAGVSWPLNETMKASVGALWLEQPIDDDVRGFGITLDEIWGIGAGINFARENGDDFDVNVSLLDTGSAPIDTEFHPIKGRVAGEFEDPYVLAIDFSYHWR